MWVQLWTRLATDLNSDGVTANRVLLDIANELDSRDVLWAAGNGSPGGAALYLMAMDSLYKVRLSAHYAVSERSTCVGCLLSTQPWAVCR